MTPFAATPSPSPSPSVDLSTLTDADLGVLPGLLSFVAFVLLAVAVYVIYRSMNRQLERIDFPEDGNSEGTAPDAPGQPGPASGS